MFDGVGGRGKEIVCWVGSPQFPCCVAGADGGVACPRSKVHGVVGVKSVTRGELDGSRDEAAVAGGEAAENVGDGVASCGG